tara:strand:- start:36 stop:821 length:786 start_codon:yes stop_codon:yes gene_type:complete
MKLNYKLKKKVHDFWVRRSKKKDHLVCTNDPKLDQLEIDQILNKINNNKSILEVGCGNGFILKRLLKEKKIKNYFGIDFVDDFISLAKKKYKLNKVNFAIFDISLTNNRTFDTKYDYIISKRTIQNILSRKMQLNVIDKLGYHLKANGLMILVESSQTAQKKINKCRKLFGLPIIKPPFHNLFFDDRIIRNYKFKNIKLLKIDNFASGFYFLSRIIYASYAKILKKKLDYKNPLNQLGLNINSKIFKEDFSQIKVYLFKKK